MNIKNRNGLFVFFITIVFMFSFINGGSAQDAQNEISHYTCGMHPSVRVSVENYKKGDTKCPICAMPLTPVKMGGMQMGGLDTNVISKVEIKAKELQLAGVKMEPVVKRQLFKERKFSNRFSKPDYRCCCLSIWGEHWNRPKIKVR